MIKKKFFINKKKPGAVSFKLLGLVLFLALFLLGPLVFAWSDGGSSSDSSNSPDGMGGYGGGSGSNFGGNSNNGGNNSVGSGSFDNPYSGSLAGLDNIQTNSFGERVGFDSVLGGWVSEASGGNGGNGGGGTSTPNCSPWSAWSACAGPCGSTGTQTSTCTFCDFSEWGGGGCVDYVDAQACTTAACPCVPSCACAATTCVGSTCSNGCGGTCAGTLTDTVWNPNPNTVCSGVPFTQTGTSCGTTRAAVGTKVCSGGYCGPQTYSCSAGNVFNTYSDWYSNLCSSGLCNYVLTITNFCGSTQNCGTERCTDSSVWRERCKDGDVWEFQWGKDDSCSTTTGCDTNIYHECSNTERIKENCESGTVCKMVTSIDAECATKSSTWTED